MKQGTLKIDSENILPIIKKWLYSDKDIFLRELVSNATDAIQKVKILSEEEGFSLGDAPFRIDISLDKENKLLTISDNGIGMTGDEIEKYIAHLAFSGASEFIKKYQKLDEQDPFIGHFGLGFYSAFMVSSLVEIDSLSYQEGSLPAYWSCDGSHTYTIGPGKRTTRGTTITLHLSDEDYLSEEHIKKILTTYLSFLPYPIYFGETHINAKEPLWLKKPSDCTEEDYLSFYRTLYPFEGEPIFWVHLNIDHPFHLKGILYFPKITPRFDFQTAKIKLFCNRVFVTDNLKDLFPDYLTILRGAIDSSDIPLNVSRSYLQMDAQVRKLSSHISKKIADRLQSLYTESKEKFTTYWPDIEMILKLGILQDEKFYERAKSFLLWKTIDNTWTTLEEYLDRHKEEYKEKVFYSTADTEKAAFLDLYKEKGIEVLLAKGPLDTSLFSFLEQKFKIHFQRIDGAMHDALLEETPSSLDTSTLTSLVKEGLGESSIEVETKPLSSKTLPALVLIDEGMRRMRDYLAMTHKEMPHDLLGKHTLLLNTNSPLIQSLATLEKKDHDLAKDLLRQIYNLSLLSQKEMHPEKVTSVVTDLLGVLERLLASSLGK